LNPQIFLFLQHRAPFTLEGLTLSLGKSEEPSSIHVRMFFQSPPFLHVCRSPAHSPFKRRVLGKQVVSVPLPPNILAPFPYLFFGPSFPFFSWTIPSGETTGCPNSISLFRRETLGTHKLFFFFFFFFCFVIALTLFRDTRTIAPLEQILFPFFGIFSPFSAP